MLNTNGKNGFDKVYHIESLEPRRFLSVTATEAVAPTDQAAPTQTSDDSYSADTWGGSSDSAPVPQAADGSGDVAPTDEATDGTFSTTDWGDGSGVVALPTMIRAGGVKPGGQGHSHHQTNGSPPPAQAAGFATPADLGAVTKSVLGISDGGVLD